MFFEKKHGQHDRLKHKKSPISQNRKRRHQNHSTGIESTVKEISSDIFREFLTAIPEKLRGQISTKNAQKCPKNYKRVFRWRRKTLKIIRKSYQRITIRKRNLRITIMTSLETDDLNNDEQLHWNRVPCPYLLKFVDI